MNGSVLARHGGGQLPGTRNWTPDVLAAQFRQELARLPAGTPVASVAVIKGRTSATAEAIGQAITTLAGEGRLEHRRGADGLCVAAAGTALTSSGGGRPGFFVRAAAEAAQAAEDVHSLLRAGQLRPGDRFPREHLSRAYDGRVIASALSLLVTAGEVVMGSGGYRMAARQPAQRPPAPRHVTDHDGGCRGLSGQHPGLMLAVRVIRLGGTRGGIAIVDPEDYPAAAGHSWVANIAYGQAARGQYVVTWIRPPQGGPAELWSLGRFVTGHRNTGYINGNTFDCRRVNLCDVSNGKYKSAIPPRAGKKSRFKGVFPGDNGRWASRIQVEGKRRRLGQFDTEEDAARAYDTALAAAYGDYAMTNQRLGLFTETARKGTPR